MRLPQQERHEMKIPDVPIRDLNGVQMKNSDQSPAMMRGLIESTLLTLPPGAVAGGEDSFQRFKIARKVHDGEEITIEEAAQIKTACASFCSPLAYGRIVETLEGLAQPEPAKPPKKR